MSATGIQNFWNKVDKSGDCWVWNGGLQSGGYGHFWCKGKDFIAHRFAWQISFGDIPKGLCVCHKCDNRKCVNPEHLWLGTPHDNTQDMLQKGRAATGEKHHSHLHPENVRRGEKAFKAKLTADIVREIRTLYATGNYSKSELGRKFGVGHKSIECLINFKSWRHIQDEAISNGNNSGVY